jgi:TATA-box binding protein (TBP) (component of TFIID and TFIIIB)
MPKTKALINIENVVVAVALNQQVDLNAIVKNFPGLEETEKGASSY